MVIKFQLIVENVQIFRAKQRKPLLANLVDIGGVLLAG